MMKKILRGFIWTGILTSFLGLGLTKISVQQELVFPFVTTIAGYRTDLVVLNPEDESRNVSAVIRVYDRGIGRRTASFQLHSNSIFSYAPWADLVPPKYNGWARLTYWSPVRFSAWSELRLVNPTPPTIVQIPAVEPALEFHVAGILEEDQETALSIVNPSEMQVRIDVTLFDAGGVVEIENALEIPPLKRLSRFLWELLTEGTTNPPERPSDGQIRTLRVRGNIPIAMGALRFFPTSGAFFNLPVVRIESD